MMSGVQSHRRAAVAIGAALVGCAAATLVVSLSPGLRFAYRLPALHVSIETAAAVIGVVAAYLVAGRFQRRRRLDDLILAIALSLLAGTNLVFGTIPAALANGPTPFATWGAIAGRVLGGLAFAAAAFAPPLRKVCSQQAVRTMVAAPLVLLAAAVVVVALAHDSLPVGVEADVAPESSARPRLVGHPAVLAVQLLLMTVYAAAAVGFARRFAREGDQLTGWLAVAAVFGAFARLNYFLYPSLYSEWVYTGDAFRLLFYVAILVAAAREMRSYWRAAAHAAVVEERRRLARDLHDGLAQELALIRRNVRRLDRESPIVQRVERGAARALEESRRAITALSEPLDRPFDAVLAEVAQDVAAREGTRVALRLAPDVRVTPAQGDALVRIASEAITNAARHGDAQLVRVDLLADGAVSLRIADGEKGFDPSVRRAGGFGLVSMQQRAEALGGRLRVTARPGHGTEIEVTL